MESLFSVSNYNYLLIPLILLGTAVLSATYIIRHKKNKINKFLTRSIILFLLIYLPLLDYWSFWNVSWFWPSDFYHASGSVLSKPNESTFGHYPLAQIIFTFLSLSSNFLFYFSSVLFIRLIQLKGGEKFRLLDWLPIINSFSLGLKLRKLIHSNWRQTLVLKLWILFSFLFAYYRFAAGWLFIEGIDTITFIDNLIFPEAPERSEEIQNYDLGYTYVTDMLNIITPPLLFISAVLTLVIVNFISRHHHKSEEIIISEIGKS